MANSGVDDVTINLYERAESSDINLLQSNISKAFVEYNRYQIGIDRRQMGDDATSPNTALLEIPRNTTADAVLVTRVLGGLLINPQGSQIFIDPGALVTVNPQAGQPGESDLTVAFSDGVSDNSLAFKLSTSDSEKTDRIATPRAKDSLCTIPN